MTPLGDNGNKTRSRLFQVVILQQQKVSTVVRCSLNLASDGYEMTFDALSLLNSDRAIVKLVGIPATNTIV